MLAKRPKRDWSIEEKIRILAKASTLTGAELSDLLQREGVLQAEYEQWRLALGEEGRASLATVKRIRALERELARNEKALAEAAALPGREKFARLTAQEERAGLFAETASIGTRDGWRALLARHGLGTWPKTFRRGRRKILVVARDDRQTVAPGSRSDPSPEHHIERVERVNEEVAALGGVRRNARTNSRNFDGKRWLIAAGALLGLLVVGLAVAARQVSPWLHGKVVDVLSERLDSEVLEGVQNGTDGVRGGAYDAGRESIRLSPPVGDGERPDGLLFIVIHCPERDFQAHEGTFHQLLRSVRIKR